MRLWIGTSTFKYRSYVWSYNVGARVRVGARQHYLIIFNPFICMLNWRNPNHNNCTDHSAEFISSPGLSSGSCEFLGYTYNILKVHYDNPHDIIEIIPVIDYPPSWRESPSPPPPPLPPPVIGRVRIMLQTPLLLKFHLKTRITSTVYCQSIKWNAGN